METQASAGSGSTLKTGTIFFMTLMVCYLGILAVLLVSAGCVDPAGSSGDSNRSGMSSTGQHAVALVSGYSDPHTVPVETAYNETLDTFWRFAIKGKGPYAADRNWTSASLDPTPSIIYDVNGEPLYYVFYLRSGSGIPGYFWTTANKLLGTPVFRICEGTPAINYSIAMADAEPIVKSRYPDYPVLSRITVIYSDPYTGTQFTLRNTSSGSLEKIVIDSYTHEVVPNHPSDDNRGHVYAWSYLDSIPQSDWPANIVRWELLDSNATPIVDYVMAQGINPQLPLSEKNASIIRNYYEAKSQEQSARAGPSQETDESYLQTDGRPITDDLIRENAVPVETARLQAQSTLWERQVDRPEIYGYLSYRNATLDSREPAIIEDFEGRNLYYVFGVKRSGIAISEIIVGANKGLFSHPWGLETPAGDYDIVNATQIARDMAARDFHGSAVLSLRPVYSLADNCCHNVTIMMEVETPGTRGINRILVDAYTLNRRVEPVTGNEDHEVNQSLFCKVTPTDFADNIRRWKEDNQKDRDFIAYAQLQEIPAARPLTDREIVTLGTYFSKTAPVYWQGREPFNPLYSEPDHIPTLDATTRAWHEQADWFTYIEVDASLSDGDIGRIVASHRIPYYYTVRVWQASIERNYYLRVDEADYNRTFQILTGNGSAGVPEPVTAMREYVQILKRKNGTVTIPVGIGAPKEANYLHLKEQGVLLKPMKTVEIDYDPAMKKSEQEKMLAELNSDDRVLFALKEYPG